MTKYEGYRMICEMYNKTKFPFFTKTELLAKGLTDKMFWALNREELIFRRDGLNDRLIELNLEKLEDGCVHTSPDRD